MAYRLWCNRIVVDVVIVVIALTRRHIKRLQVVMVVMVVPAHASGTFMHAGGRRWILLQGFAQEEAETDNNENELPSVQLDGTNA